MPQGRKEDTMILADKIMNLRKQNGWSQEELADKLDISRQSVSKWESGTSIPDLDKILKLSTLFGVSTDYLLRDEIEDTLYMEVEMPEDNGVHRVSMDEAMDAIDNKKRTSVWMGLATMLCVLCPTPLLFLLGLQSTGKLGLTEDTTAMIGVVTLLLLVAIGVALFIVIDSFNKKYAYLDNELLVLDYGVRGVVEKEKSEFNLKYVVCTAIATVMCILAVVPLFAMIAVTEMGTNAYEEDFLILTGVVIMFLLVAVAVFLFVWANSMQGVYNQLLQVKEYTRKNKSQKNKKEAVSSIYWTLVTAIYLGVSFWTMDWHITWIIWVVAGVGSAVLDGIFSLLSDKTTES